MPTHTRIPVLFKVIPWVCQDKAEQDRHGAGPARMMAVVEMLPTSQSGGWLASRTE